MSIWAIIPVKPLNRSKSRLASVMSPEERQAFSSTMLSHTLDVLAQSRDIEKILVISRDSKALRVARDHNAHTVTESGTPELNATLARAANMAKNFGAEALLIMSTDMPLLMPSDVQSIIASANSKRESVVLAPDRHELSTNAIFIRPPNIVPFMFGPDSFARYVSLAHDHGIESHVVRTQGLALDVDVPQDLELYRDVSRQVETQVDR